MRHLVTAAVAALALAFTTTAIAEPLVAAPVAKKKKKCFKKKHGKRVRVKCKAKKKPPATQTPSTQTPTTQTPTSTTPPAADPVKDRMTFLLSGEMLRHFANSSDAGGFQGEETLHMCSDKTYGYVSQFAGSTGGLTETSKSQESGRWEITQAEITPDQSEIFGKVKLTPGDGSAPYEININLVDDGAGGITTLVNRERWFRVASTACS
jgi:hypothetical protein